MKVIKPGQKIYRSVTIEPPTDSESRILELSFSSSEPVLRQFLFDRFYEILDHSPGSVRLDRFNNHAPLLIDHENSVRSQVGVIESAKIVDGWVGRAFVRFGNGALDEEMLQKVRDGIIRNVSFGYIVYNSVREERKIDGLDVIRVTDFEPLEISLVGVPADASIGIGRSNNSIEFIEINQEVKTMTNEVEEKKEAQSSAQPSVDVELLKERAAKDANKRVRDMIAVGKKYANVGGVELAAKAIEEGATIEELQRSILDTISTKKTEAFDKGARVEENIEQDKAAGFRNFGDFAKSVLDACQSTRYDDRLKTRAASTISMSDSGPEGGYLIPEQFGTEIVRLALEEDSLLSLVENTPVSGNGMTFPTDEGTPWGTTGVQAYWEGEAVTSKQSKETELEDRSFRLKKLRILVPVSDELLSDAVAMSSHLTRKMSIRLDWKVQDSIVNGTGIGQPQGITKSNAVVVQAKETSQVADTIVIENLAKMSGRIIEGAGSRIVWLINPDAYPQLITLNSGGNLVWTPPAAGFKAAPGGTLLGRPIIKTDTCQTLGDKFDIILANMAGYQAITKAGGVELATSMHLWFDQGVQAFRLTFRMDGQTLLKKPVTPPNSSVTRSHFVTLAARA